MKKIKPIKKLDLNFKSYISLVYLAFSIPNYYAQSLPKSLTTKKALNFLIINLSVLLIVQISLRALFYRDLNYLFFGLSESVFLLPVLILLVFFLIITLHLIALALGGKANFNSTFKSVAYCSVPLTFLGVPIIGGAAIFLMLYLVSVNFRSVHGLSKLKSVIVVSIPLLLLLLGTLILGVPLYETYFS